MSYSKLDALGRKLEALEHALSILGADEATHMAVGGGEKRAEAMANLAGMYHTQATAPEIGDWIAEARSEDLNEDQKPTYGCRWQFYLTLLPIVSMHHASLQWHHVLPKLQTCSLQ